MKSNTHINKLTLRKKIKYSIITFLISVSIILILGEIMVRIFNPQVIMYPRTNYSPDYGLIWPANTKIINKRPGHWRFVYTTNKFNCRGKAIRISNSYEKPNIIVLGDSYSFGQGVNDGEEYASIISNKLKNEYNIVNLGGSGWGLTQEIKRFYKFGQLYQPKIIILQFDGTDPEDNFDYKITKIKNNRFIFNNNLHIESSFKKYLSNSIIQKSCLYNLIRHNLRPLFFNNCTPKYNRKNSSLTNISKVNITPEEKFYVDLLELFCRDVKKRGIKLVMISVNNQLNKFPYIKSRIKILNEQKLLDYQEVNDWFKLSEEIKSPEGHFWGGKAHKIIGIKLSNLIKEKFVISSFQNSN